MDHDPKQVVLIRYRNWRGETGPRRVVPIRLRFAASQWHTVDQWLMDAWDVDKGAERTFALKDISLWGES